MPLCVDTVAERSALMERVYPQLYLYCKQRGFDFRMVELRRGMTDSVSDHHFSTELHIEMLKKCQETEGPNFFVSLACLLMFVNLFHLMDTVTPHFHADQQSMVDF